MLIYQRPGNNRRNRYCAMLLLTILSAGMAFAADPKAAVTDINQVDGDFALTGEFVGTVAANPKRPNKVRPISLQIRATGGGTFEAMQYPAGLPGSRKRGQAPLKLIGKQHDGFLVLSGGPWAILAQNDLLLLIDRNGKRAGQLNRTERESPTMGAKPPKNAIVLFDGTNVDQFTNGRMTEDGLLMEGADVKPMFQDFNLHLEFMLPYMPAARDQGRSNSGVYLQSRYEVQILDSFAMEPRNNGCGGLYRFRNPDINMSFPPLRWQTYDIVFTAPRWASDGKKLKNARITVWHNGVKIHNKVELPNKTGAGKPEEPTLLPIRLQNHGNPIRFRNIWIIDRGARPSARFPVRPRPMGARQPKEGEPAKDGKQPDADDKR